MADEQTQSKRPKSQTPDDALEQAKSDALSPEQKHKNYLEDLERLHGESVVDSLGHTPRAGQLAQSWWPVVANLADKSGDAYSNIVQGKGTATATFVMPGTVPLAVSSVVATVDNAAGGDTRATLVIRDQAGEVIATKRQGDVIPAGDTGTATWALRLDDEQPPLADRRAYTRFVGSELAADATKVLVSGIAGSIIIPLDWYVVPSPDYDPFGGQPDLNMETPTYGWDFRNVDSFGKTYYNTITVYGSAGGSDTIPLSLTGERLQVRATSNGATSAVGHIEVFVRYYTVAVRP